MPRDLQLGLALRRNLHNAAFARKRRGNVQISHHVKGKSVRPSQPAEKSVHRSLRIHSVHAVKARCGGSGNKQIPLRPKSEVVSRNARLQSGEDEYLLVAANLENRSAAVAHV